MVVSPAVTGAGSSPSLEPEANQRDQQGQDRERDPQPARAQRGSFVRESQRSPSEAWGAGPCVAPEGEGFTANAPRSSTR
jgi:hypothetical protein